MEEIKLKKTLGEWQEIHMGIQALMQESLPFKEAYWLARNADRIEPVIKRLDQVRLIMLGEMADKGEDGKPIMLEPPPGVQGQQFQLKENWRAFQDAWNEVIAQEETIEIRLLSFDRMAEKLETVKPIILKSMLCLFTE